MSDLKLNKVMYKPVELKVEVPKQKEYNEIDTISIISLIDAKLTITGTVTGKLYVFNGAGTAQEVDILDADDMLNKKRGKACCGGTSTPLFQKA